MRSGKVERQTGEPGLQRVMALLEHGIPRATQMGSQQGYICNFQKHQGWVVRRLTVVTPPKNNNPFPSFTPEQIFGPGTH